jgi:hypothetical protein
MLTPRWELKLNGVDEQNLYSFVYKVHSFHHDILGRKYITYNKQKLRDPHMA